MITRRQFIQRTATAALVAGSSSSFQTLAASSKKACGVRTLKKPVAIAMWDFSWLLRHDPGCEFADWDQVLDDLVKRGYNAIRFDAFPHLVGSAPDGRVIGTYHFPKSGWKPVMWGNQYSTIVNPRRALKEFIPRCLDRGLHLGLSTWFLGPGVERFEGSDGLVRAWEETLRFLKANDLLHNIYYVDLLNEYPLFNGFAWLRNQMDGDIKARADRAQTEGVHEWKEKGGDYSSPASREIYVRFANDAIARLQANWPELDFLFSLTYSGAADWRAMAPAKVTALDVHYWFIMNPLLADETGYWKNIHTLADNDHEFPNVQAALLKNWTAHKPKLVEWMDQQMGEVAALGRQHNKPVGNTEGWGTINWLDHPALTWELIKEAAEICAKLGRKHGYRFNCTSNFTHPQFPRLWADAKWHQRVTAVIRGR